MLKKLVAITAVSAVALGVFLAGPSSASADYQYVEFAGNAYEVSQYHYAVNVCDYDVDGSYAYVIVEFADGSQAEERDGGDSGCDYESWSRPFYYYKVCEEAGRPGRVGDLCSTWLDS